MSNISVPFLSNHHRQTDANTRRTIITSKAPYLSVSWSVYQVCCDYVRSPLTLYGRKFDVRFFLMLRSAGDRSVSMRT